MVLGRGRAKAGAARAGVPGLPGGGSVEAPAKAPVVGAVMGVPAAKSSPSKASSKTRSSSGVSSTSDEAEVAVAVGRGRGFLRREHQPRKPLLPTNPRQTHDLPTPSPVKALNDLTQDLTLDSFPDHTSTESSANLMEEEVVGRRRELSLGGTVATGVMPAGRRGKAVDVATNLHDLNIAPSAVVHRYRLDMEKRNLRTESSHDMGKGAGNDHLLNRKREQCFVVFSKAKATYPQIFGNPASVAYDRRNLVYTTELFKFPDGTEEGEVCVEMSPDELPGSEDPHCFVIRLQYESKLNLADLSGLTTLNLGERNREVQQIMETILAQHLYQQPEHLVHFGCKSYERKPAKDLGNGRYLARGFFKSLQPTSDAQGNNTLSMVIDNKNAAFYKPQMALQTLGEVLALLNRARAPYTEQQFAGYTLTEREVRHASQYFRDINVRDCSTKRPVTVSGLTLKTAEQLTITYRDNKNGGLEREVSLVKFFKDVLKCDLKFPKLQCFYQRCRDGKRRYFPVEVCWVNESQRVPLVRQTPDMMQQMIKESALKPSDLKATLVRKLRDSQLLHNDVLQAFGMQMKSEARVVKGRVVPKPEVKYGGGASARVDGKGDWKIGRGRYHSAGTTKGWAVVSVCTLLKDDPATLTAFAGALVKDAKAKGLILPPPVLTSSRFEAIDAVFTNAAKNGCDFLLFVVGDDKSPWVKDKIKLAEALSGIVTQCVTLNKARDIGKNNRGAWQVTENILNKTNMKLGGLNYELSVGAGATPRWLAKGKVLILGCDVNHPPPQPASLRHLPPREPSVVGFVGNSPVKPLLFTGEIALQGAREEMVDNIADLTKEMLRRWALDSKTLPEEIIYFRDGVSDGQFKELIEREVEGVRDAYKRLSPNNPKITCLVAKKRHHFRMFQRTLNPGDRAMAQDLEPGTVLDSASGVTHPGQANFFLKSHIALQGTARATHYTCLVNEGGFDQDELDQLVFTLSHGHQIVTKSVSLPAPVYGAHEMAERGKRLWRAMNEVDDAASTSTPDSAAAPLDFVALNAKLRVSNFPKLARSKHWA